VRRAALAFLLVLAIGGAGGLSATVLAGPLPHVLTGSTPTTAPETTTSGTTVAAEARIASGVTIGSVVVGGLTASEASEAVEAQFKLPLVLVVARHRLAPTAGQLGATANVAQAVAQAAAASPGTSVALRVQVRREKVRRYVGLVARRFDRKPVDAQLSLRNLRPYIAPEQPGRALLRRRAVRAIVAALLTNRRGPIRLGQARVPATVTKRAFGPIIVIRRGSNRLYFYEGTRFRRRFGVATGQSIYPTPLGRFTIVVKWRNPWWYPPASPWARGLKPVPPGPGNPLGTRWMGLSAPGVGIHGTPDAASIGYSASHGCIRMHISEAEWLFDRVRIGTPVFIVAA
jgi:hypothetical protein